MPAPEAENDSRTPSDWNRAITFGMNMTDGNSDTLRYALGLDAAKERKQDTTRIRARAAYGESENQKDTEYATALYRYDRQLSHRFYVLGNADWFTDTIADVDYRLIGIISPGFHLWRSDSTVGKLELGAGYLAEEKGSGQDAFAAGRAAGALERIINAHILTWASIEYLPKLTDSTVFYINSELGLAAMLTRDLNLNLTFEDRYDNTPATDKNSNDLAFTTSLSLKF
jgi:putative salt-induced outer membrane protein YdiY